MTDDDALRAFREAAAVPPPSAFMTARAGRSLAALLDRDSVRDETTVRDGAVRWSSGRVAAVALAAAVSTGALAVIADDVLHPTLTASAAVPAFEPSAVEEAVVGVPAIAAAEPVVVDVPAAVALVPRAQTSTPPLDNARRRSAKAEGPVTEAEAEGRARSLVASLQREPSASTFASLALLARRFPAAIVAVDDELALLRSADVMRLRCQHRLLHARDATAMAACRAFAQEHPQDPAARVLSFAAGRLAEDRQDVAWAEEEYSRVLLLSPFSGLSGTDALLARARVRFAAGDDLEARADLRLYLHSEPSARHEPAVAELAQALGL